MERQELLDHTEAAKELVDSRFGKDMQVVGFLPGTGWKFANDLPAQESLGYDEIQGLPGNDNQVPDHKKGAKMVEIAGEPTLVIGRVHSNENYSDPEIGFAMRIIIDAMRERLKGLIITNGAGTLHGEIDYGYNIAPGINQIANWASNRIFNALSFIERGGKAPQQIKVGDVSVIGDIETSALGPNSPLTAGEFVDWYHNGIRGFEGQPIALAQQVVQEIQGYCKEATYAYRPGPQFEGRQDKLNIKKYADLVGMSTIIEVLLATLLEVEQETGKLIKPNIPFVSLSLATNGPFASHSHEDNTAMGIRNAEKCERIITELVSRWPNLIEL